MPAQPMTRRAGRGPAVAKGGKRAPTERLPRWAPLVLLAALLLVSSAPRESNLYWAVDGLRSLGTSPRFLAMLVAAGFAAWAAGVRVPGVLVALAGALALAWPLREAGHFLGDTYVRWRQIDAALAGGPVPGFAEFARQMHAQPLDDLLGLWGPIHLARAGLSPVFSISAASAALALLFFGSAWRIARRLVPAGPAAPLAAALALAGSLEVFAGYAESGGTVLAVGALWWFALLRPLSRRRDALLAALAWLALALAHRVALVALVPQFARSLAVRLDGDQPGPRRDLLLGTLAAAALAALAGAPGAGGALGRDAAELLATLGRLTPPADLANLLVLVMPLALLGPWLVGTEALVATARSPQARLHAIALVPLAPLLLFYPVAAHGLGAHRDWELAVLPGFVATSFAGHALARLDEARRRAALTLLLPALALFACAWVFVNADEAATLRRAEALVSAPFGAAGEHRGHALVYLGYRASDRGDDTASGRWFDASFVALPNRRNALLAAESWLRAGESGSCRASLARARSLGKLPDDLERGAVILERLADRADSAASARGQRP